MKFTKTLLCFGLLTLEAVRGASGGDYATCEGTCGKMFLKRALGEFGLCGVCSKPAEATAASEKQMCWGRCMRTLPTSELKYGALGIRKLCEPCSQLNLPLATFTRG